jgi:phenylacetate-CoA ligase
MDFKTPPGIVFTGAETLYEDQRNLISEVFSCPVTDQYGFSEGCGNASRCQEDVFHEDFEYGILECVDPEWLDKDTKRGRIVATGFASYGMPFIRYDVGDIGIWKTARCACGRESDVLLQIEGRLEDYIVTPEGRRIRRFDYIFKDTHSVKEAQVIQRKEGSICLRIVRRSEYSPSDETTIRDDIRKMISPQLKVAFEYVDTIPREPNGKFRAVKSLIGN